MTIPTDLGIILRNPPDSYDEWERLVRLAVQWERVKVLLDGLNSIASWADGPIVNGTFDEPASAATARRTLQAYNGGRLT